MAEVEHNLILEGVAEAILAQPGNTALESALLTKLWAHKQEELYARALAEVTEQQREQWRAKEERWQAQKVAERRALVREAAQAAEADKTREMRLEREEFETRLGRLIAQRDAWKTRALMAEEWVVDHLRHLLPDESYVLLRHVEITRLRLHTANTILQHAGLEIRSRLTDAAPVTVEIGPAHWEQRSRFRCVRIGLGTVDEIADEDEGAGVRVGASQNSPQVG